MLVHDYELQFIMLLNCCSAIQRTKSLKLESGFVMQLRVLGIVPVNYYGNCDLCLLYFWNEHFPRESFVIEGNISSMESVHTQRKL